MRGDRDHELIGLYFRLVTEHRHETFQPSMMPGGLSMPYLLNRFFGRDTEAPPRGDIKRKKTFDAALIHFCC